MAVSGSSLAPSPPAALDWFRRSRDVEEAGFPQRSNEIDYSSWKDKYKPQVKGRRHLKNNFEDGLEEEETNGFGGDE